jgi:hypothetical protein
MRSSSPDTLQPLTVAEQLDAMLLGWLERRAANHEARQAGIQAVAVVTVAERVLEEVEAFCGRWDMTISRTHRGDGAWVVLEVQGPVLPVQGFTEITRMYRR